MASQVWNKDSQSASALVLAPSSFWVSEFPANTKTTPKKSSGKHVVWSLISEMRLDLIASSLLKFVTRKNLTTHGSIDTPDPKSWGWTIVVVVVSALVSSAGASPEPIELWRKAMARTIARSANNQPARLPELDRDFLFATSYWSERWASFTALYWSAE